MRWGARSACGLGLAIACGCARTEAPAATPSPDELVLELGGDSPSLRAALLRLAGKIEPPPPAMPPGQPLVAPPGPGERSPDPDPPPRVEPPPRVPPSPPRTVRLRPGGTLYALASEHLGDGNRWREIAALNGWTEAQAGRLPANVEVKLPPK